MTNIPFEESYRGYKMQANGTHTGPSNLFPDSEHLQAWIKDWVETTYELRVVDDGDMTVMQIIEGVVVFPQMDPTKGQLIWDNKTHDWGFLPLSTISENSAIGALFKASKMAKGPDGRFTRCIQCKAPFTEANVHSALGWKETQISGFCENCFNAIFA